MLPEMEGGVWANFARVSHSPYEFTLDFIRLDYTTEDPLEGVLVQRVNMSSQFVEQLIKALDDNLSSWTSNFVPPDLGLLQDDERDD